MRLKYLDPEVLSKVERLDLVARYVVEGYLAGMHKSPYRGFAVEFAQHRQYVPGDDSKHIDWRVYAKTERYYIRQYEEETNFICHILLDASESMKYASGTISKLEYAKYMTASLAYLILKQRDAVGLGIFDRRIRTLLEPSSSPAHLTTIVHQLEAARPEEKTGIGDILHKFAASLKKRGIVVLISDLFDSPESIISGLEHLRFEGHEVIFFHLLDHYERTFPFRGMIRFLGLEEYPEMLAEPQRLRKSYLAQLNQFEETLMEAAYLEKCDFVPVDTSDSMGLVLSSYLSRRLKERKR